MDKFVKEAGLKGRKLTLSYDELNCEDTPRFCPFCAEHILEDDLEQDEDY